MSFGDLDHNRENEENRTDCLLLDELVLLKLTACCNSPQCPPEGAAVLQRSCAIKFLKYWHQPNKRRKPKQPAAARIMMRIQFALTCLASRYSNRFLWAAEMEEIRVGNNHKQRRRSLGARSLTHDIDSTHMYRQTLEAIHLRLNNLIGRDAPHIVAADLIPYGLRLEHFAPQGFHFLMEAKEIHPLSLIPVEYHLLFSPEYICWKCTLGTAIHSQKVFCGFRIY